ncbi:hypothetical protein HO173_000637 [Letharia columbiana]|uniref:Uncharacterized protein n=1 Tax=Letharia columbiana TaxID=112416 RepID=A0A8H6L9L1_9LECA|nr:uncharacterized protein HO173_000637 [Letharia columbiana]KAF6240845.1 hypothetical protein HO173_000637 [Letharia columbiana]
MNPLDNTFRNTKILVLLFIAQLQSATMRLFPRSILGSLGSVISPKKGKDKGAGQDAAAPSVPAAGKDIPTPSIPVVGNDLPTPSVPGIANDIPTPNVTDLHKDSPTSSAAGAAKGTPVPSAAGAESASDRNVNPSIFTTFVTVSVTDISTVTSADVTVTIVQHDLATVATTAPTTVTVIQHTLATVGTTVATTIIKTKSVTPSTEHIAAAHSTAPLPPAVAAMPTAKKHVDPAVVLSVIFGLIILGLLGAVCLLVTRSRRRAAKAKQTTGKKTYAEEFEWPRQRPVEMDDIKKKDEWGPVQKDARGVV